MEIKEKVLGVGDLFRASPTLAPRLIFTALSVIAIALLLAVLLVPPKYDPDEAPYYLGGCFKVIKPAGWGWSAEKRGESLLFRRGRDAAIVIDAEIDNKNEYRAVDLNPAVLTDFTESVLSAYKLPREDLRVNSDEIRGDRQEWVFTAASFDFTVKDYEGIGFIFYSNDLRCLFLGIWKTCYRDRYAHVIKACKNYIRLLPPYNEPLFVRPIIDSSEGIDYLELQKDAQNRVKLARQLWNNRQSNVHNIRLAMEAFETAFRRIAEADDPAFAIESDSRELYLKCKKARKAQIDRMVSQIVQQAKLRNNETAARLTRQLIDMATLESEAKIREWAKQQYNILKAKTEEKP